MSAVTQTFLLSAGGEPVEAVAQQIARWCRRWPAKDLARRLNVSVRTAEGWQQGNFPQGRHLTAMVAMWGAAFLDTVYAPVLEDQALDRRLEAVEATIADLRKDLIDHADTAPSRPAIATPAHLGSGAARARGAVVAAARGLIVGIVIGAGALHMVPQLPDTIAGLVTVSDEYARLPRGTGARGQRALSRAPSAARRST